MPVRTAPKPRLAIDYPEFAKFMREKGFDSPRKIAIHLEVEESALSKLSRGLTRPSGDLIAAVWAKYPPEGSIRFFYVNKDAR